MYKSVLKYDFIKIEESKPLLMVGAFPPPMCGLAHVNSAIYNCFRAAGLSPTVVDVSADNFQRSLVSRLSRLPKVIRAMLVLLVNKRTRNSVLYMSVSGGLGQVYEIVYLLLARLRKLRVYLHHHSYAYIDVPNQLTGWLLRLAGDNSVHITLSLKMAQRLQKTYGIKNVVAISNAVFFVDREIKATVRECVKSVGFLGNISAEKGVFEFLELCAEAQNNGLALRGLLAGPFQNSETEHAVRKRLVTLSNVEYIGPQYGENKKNFLAGIDVLIFPTRYVNEAEPVTVHEAMRQGVPVIAYGRGAIPEIIGIDCGRVIDPAEPFVATALAQVKAWQCDPVMFKAVSKAALRRFCEIDLQNQERWQMLLREIIDVSVTGPATIAEKEKSS